MTDKLITAQEAASWVKDGMHLGLGAGMTMNPMAVVREIIRQGVKGLNLTPVLTGGYVADLMIGAGCVETVQFPQIVLDEFGLAPNFRRKCERGELKLLETI
jgi:glutaconate CoA-transferase subunit A